MNKMTSDLPPAYNSLHTSTANIAVEEGSDPSCDDEPETIFINSFEDKTTRIGFIQKVLSIKLLQLILMTIVMTIFAFLDWEVHRSMRRSGVHIIVLSALAFLASTGLLCYCTKARRENPYRYVFLIVQPITLTVFVCYPVTYWELLAPLALAFGTYIAAILAVLMYSVFALQTKLEFAAPHAAFLAGIVQILIYASTVPLIYVDALAVLYLALAFCLNYVYVFWDLEYMSSMKYWRRITPDSFVDGALNLYIDYYHILINVLMPHICKKSKALVHDINVGTQNHQ